MSIACGHCVSKALVCLGPVILGLHMARCLHLTCKGCIRHQAPSLLSEADLIQMMNRYGIGTDATIAQHITTVQTRDYAGGPGSSGSCAGCVHVSRTISSAIDLPPSEIDCVQCGIR